MPRYALIREYGSRIGYGEIESETEHTIKLGKDKLNIYVTRVNRSRVLATFDSKEALKDAMTKADEITASYHPHVKRLETDLHDLRNERDEKIAQVYGTTRKQLQTTHL